MHRRITISPRGEVGGDLDAVASLVEGSDLMLVVGTSALVVPASLFPGEGVARGGSLVETHVEPTPLTEHGLGPNGFFVQGPVGTTLPMLVSAVGAQVARGGGV